MRVVPKVVAMVVVPLRGPDYIWGNLVDGAPCDYWISSLDIGEQILERGSGDLVRVKGTSVRG